MTEAALGHNGGPPLDEPRRPRKLTIRTQWAKALFADKRTPSYVIAMSWAIHWYSQDDGSGAALSNEQFETMCGVPDRTVSRGKKWLYDHGYVSLKVGRSGQKTRFQMVIPDMDEILRQQIEIEKAEVYEPAMEADTARQTGVLQPATVAALENSIRQGGGIEEKQDATVAASNEAIRQTGDVNPPEGRTAGRQGGDLILESNQERKQEDSESACAREIEFVPEETIEPVVYQRRRIEKPQTSTRQQWAAALGGDAHRCTEIVDGQVRLLNGTRTDWIAWFGGDEAGLDLALIEISGQIQLNSSQSIDKQVLSKLAGIVRNKRERDTRYEKTVERNKAGGRQASNTQAGPGGGAEVALRALRTALDRKAAKTGGAQ